MSEQSEPVYRVYGLSFASPYPFLTPLCHSTDPPEFRFHAVDEIPVPPAAVRCYTSRKPAPNGEPALRIDRDGDVEYFRLPDGTCYRVEPHAIAVHSPDPERAVTAEIGFLGTLLAYLLERCGIPVLHAATVRVGEGAAAFLGGNGGGKSSLAAGFMQAGCPLISDDLLPLRCEEGTYLAVPGYPQMRFWPDQARHFAPGAGRLARVHPDLEKLRLPVGDEGFGRFSGEAAPLGAIYVPDRQEHAHASGEIEIVPVSPVEGVVLLSQGLFIAPLLRGLGMMGERLQSLARGVGQVPVRRVRYPSGLDALARVCEAIRADLEGSH